MLAPSADHIASSRSSSFRANPAAAAALIVRDRMSDDEFDTLYGPWASVADDEEERTPTEEGGGAGSGSPGVARRRPAASSRLRSMIEGRNRPS